ncbi:MAG TPA: hypothetical protein VLN72_03590, partial [Gillisia sp.]|nr:hypothetical protein [Gillisia sp.]
TTIGTLTVQLDENGLAAITVDDIDNGSTDNCEIENRVLDITSFDCSNIGTPVEVTLTVTDVNGNSETGTAMVTVEDNISPVVTTVGTLTVQLDENGQATITVDEIDNGSTDNCEIATRELDITGFDCSNVGTPVEVTLTVTDVNGNSETGTAMVTVEDNVSPVAIAKDITVQLDANGAATITAADIDNGSNDACGVGSLSIDITEFGCDDVGVNTVTLTVTDNNGNVSTATAVVTIEDNVDPIATTKDITVQLDENGEATITAADIDNGSSDACGVASLSLDITEFGCDDVGVNTVTLTVTDNNGNVSTATAVVTIEDNVDPIAISKDITVQLDENGEATITAADIDNGSNDACGIGNLSLDISEFGCDNVGANTVTLTVTDNNGNVSTAKAVVTVEDNVDPIAATKDITVQLDENGEATITAADIDNGSSDACDVASLLLDISEFGCDDVGVNTVILTVTDNNGNVSTATAVVTVEDNVEPVAIANDITVQLDENGEATITAADI